MYYRELIKYSYSINFHSVDDRRAHSLFALFAKIRDCFNKLVALTATALSGLTSNNCHRGTLAPSTTIAPFYRHLLTSANGTTTTGTAGARARSPGLSITVVTYFEVRSKFARKKTRQDSSIRLKKSRSSILRRLQEVATFSILSLHGSCREKKIRD